MSSLRRVRALTQHGMSLVEAVLSTFILLTALLLAVYVFDSSLKWEASNEKRVIAATLAESALAQVREAGGRDFSDLLNFDDKELPFPEYPDFQVKVAVKEASLATSCVALETQYPKSAPFPKPVGKFLNRSATNTTVTVSWKDPLPDSVQVTERIASLREVSSFKVKITTEAGGEITGLQSLTSDQTRNFRAKAFIDNDERKIVEDLQFIWYVEPITGFGSIAHVSRDGLLCQYINSYKNYHGKVQYAYGHCNLTVQATYQGRVAKAKVKINNAK